MGICCASGSWVVGEHTEVQTLKGNSSPSCMSGLPLNKGLTVSDNLSIRLHRIYRALNVEVLKNRTNVRFIFFFSESADKG